MQGPPGVGKTTTILCLARILLGPNYREGVLELNASNERGIEVVRNKIKMFAQQKVSLPKGRHKIITLDEADSMTEGAQQALHVLHWPVIQAKKLLKRFNHFVICQDFQN